jgi:hypothetical protein
MTNSSNETSKEEYDTILRKLDILLRKHQDALFNSTRVKANTDPDSRPFSVATTIPEQVPLAVGDGIPTLTEVVHLPPSLLAASSDPTVLLGRIIDSALRDANVELDIEARKILLESLQTRLFHP